MLILRGHKHTKQVFGTLSGHFQAISSAFIAVPVRRKSVAWEKGNISNKLKEMECWKGGWRQGGKQPDK